MTHKNRLAEYFAEEPTKKPGLFSSKPIHGFSGNTILLSDGPSIPLPEGYRGSILGVNGEVFDEDGNKIQYPEEF